MEGDEKQGWQEGPLETFDGVEAAEEGRNVKNQADRIDDAFQPHRSEGETVGKGAILDSSTIAFQIAPPKVFVVRFEKNLHGTFM